MTRDKYRAVLLGCAVGDTLGMPVEGWKREQILKYAGRIETPIDPVVLRDSEGNLITEDEYGKLKYWTKDFKKGEFTDDTILTLALAESLADKKEFDLWDIARRQVAEYEERLRPDGSVFGGFGGSTIKAFENFRKEGIPYTSGVLFGAGNGPAMKMHPLGMFMHATQNYMGGLEQAGLVGKITHLDPRSVVSGVIQASAIYRLLNGANKEEFLEDIFCVSKIWEENWKPKAGKDPQIDMAQRIRWISDNKDKSCEEAFNELGNSSLVYKSYPFALFMFQKFWDEPQKGLLETVNYGGDCDTTGAIFGALAGARHGMFFRESWLDDLKDKMKIVNLADRIYDLN